MNVRRPAGELTLDYEALRGQATGQLPTRTPRGLALFLAEGCAAWTQAWMPLPPAPAANRPAVSDRQPPIAPGGEVVQLLAEMALRCHRRW